MNIISCYSFHPHLAFVDSAVVQGVGDQSQCRFQLEPREYENDMREMIDMKS